MIASIVGQALKKFYLIYIAALLLCRTRKTCTQMAEATGITHDVLWRALKHISKEGGIQIGLIEAAQALLNSKRKWWFILDDSMLLKPHAKKLRQAILDRCGATGKIEKGLVAVFIAITDGETVVPIAYRFWISRKQITQVEDYRKKWEIGLELLTEVATWLPCKNLLMDGAYANRHSLKILSELGFEYEARFRKNGVLIVNGMRRSVAEMLDHLIIGPWLYQGTRAIWQNLDVFVTAHKHRNKSGETITYTISNRQVSAAQHAKDYALRWGIEMFFRTAKQSLGLQQCASADVAVQHAHIQACFTAYLLLQRQRIKKRYHSVEEVLNTLRTRYSNCNLKELLRTDQLNFIFA